MTKLNTSPRGPVLAYARDSLHSKVYCWEQNFGPPAGATGGGQRADRMALEAVSS